MDDVVAVLSADWHVRETRAAGPWVALPQVRGDDLYVLAQLADLCVANDVPLLAAGDLHDGPDPDPETVAALYELLRPVRAVYYVLGNHERGRDWLAPFGPTAVRLDGRRHLLDVNGLRYTVAGLSYTDPTRFAAAARVCGGADVGLYHQTWAELCGGGSTSLTQLPGNRLALCGDVHVRRLLPAAGGVCLSPGPLAPQRVSELMPARAFLLRADFSVEEVPLAGRTWAAVGASTEAEVPAALARIAALAPTGPDGPPATPFVDALLGPGVDARDFAAAVAAANPAAAVRVRVDKIRGRRSGRSPDPPAPADDPSVPPRPGPGVLERALLADPALTDAARALAVEVVAAADKPATLAAAQERYRSRYRSADWDPAVHPPESPCVASTPSPSVTSAGSPTPGSTSTADSSASSGPTGPASPP